MSENIEKLLQYIQTNYTDAEVLKTHSLAHNFEQDENTASFTPKKDGLIILFNN